MKRSRFFVIALIFAASLVFAQEEGDLQEAPGAGEEEWFVQTDLDDDAEPGDGAAANGVAESPGVVVSGGIAADDGEEDIPRSILNNKYYLESVRLTDLSREAFEVGDYDTSASLAEQAAEQARLSDEYVAMRLAENVLARAHSRYTWAGSVGAARRYPQEYQTAGAAYEEAVAARQNEDWEAASNSAHAVIFALAKVVGPRGEKGPYGEPPPPARGTLPSQYTVRQWRNTRDCFWIIAGWSWVYGDSYQWKILYDANKAKLGDPANPDLIKPGMVLDIPSLWGEVRSGMWDPAIKY
ncbi:MAG: LysM peptidoglycan-binding domain-containing protein [Treponema sp.]|jgi:hypothetical protein|nr:LysM peptidoglycan-binding domain-containing protein [Treponema sp.]